MDEHPLLSLRAISKSFGGVPALESVDFEVRAGEIHAIVGENGAGKSTLMNCIFGLVTPDSGTIEIEGRPVTITGPKNALAFGIGMVHQHFKLIPGLTVTENIYLGRELRRPFGFVDERAQKARVLELAERFGLEIDPDALVRDLSVGAQQRVEILRSLLTDARILILDEPTAVLTPQEYESLFATLRDVVAEGMGVVFISHHLDEVTALADRITVLRRGKRVALEQRDAVDEHRLAELIVGSELARDTPDYPAGTPGDTRLEVEGVRFVSSRGVETTEPVNFGVRAGEIVGLAGIPGNGQSELVEVIAGLRRPVAGTVRINGIDTTGATPGVVRRAGLAHIPEDRNSRGIGVHSSVSDNILVGYLDDATLGSPLLNKTKVAELVTRLVDEYDIRIAGPATLAGRLSGGNAQKVVVARELSREPDVILASEPVRGLDVAATRFVHEQLVAHRDRGAAVLLMSTELGDLLEVADRLLVISGGRIVGEFDGDLPSELEVSKLMMGAVRA